METAKFTKKEMFGSSVALPEQLRNGPNVVDKPRFHCGGDSETGTNTTEIVVREVKDSIRNDEDDSEHKF